MFDAQVLHFLAQGVAIDSQHLCRVRLVALHAVQDGFEQRLFNAVDHHVVHGARLLAIKVTEVAVARHTQSVSRASS